MKQAGDLYFNELSLQPFGNQEETKKRILTYSKVLKHCGGLGHKKVRYEYELSALKITENETLSEYCYKNFRTPELNTAINLILTTQKHPYIEDDSIQENRFVEHDYLVETDNDTCFGYGFVTAYIHDSFAIGFHSTVTWNRHCFNIIVDNDRKAPKQVFCISSMEHFDEPSFVKWYVNTYTVSYTKRVGNGVIHLRDDHGKDVLQEFSNRILKEDFVAEIVNSLPFASKANSFIEKILDNGIIHIRLTNTDRGLGLVVRTVSDDILRTTYFAKLLQEKYGC